MNNLILIGMMGCGKSTVGRLAAEKLGLAFVDTDERIERASGRTIPEIFASEGEEGFRARELDVSRALAREGGLVIACGGGLPTRAEAIAALKASGVVFWLSREPAVIYDTVSMAHRPLGQGGKEAFLERFRQRFMHKLVYFPANNKGMYSCVGCGRCVEKCPSALNIVKVIKAFEKEGGEKA